MKSTQTRKPANQEPKSLAIPTPVQTQSLLSTLDQLLQLIDLQILNTTEQEFNSVELAQFDNLPNELPNEAQQVS